MPLLLLGWQASQALGLMSLPEAMAHDADWWYRLFLLVGVCVFGIVFALLWAVVRNTRACRRAENRLQWMAHRLPGAFYVYRLNEHGLGTYEFLTVDAGNLLGVSREQILQDASVAIDLVVPEDREQLNAALEHS